jgi:hypothetical protein
MSAIEEVIRKRAHELWERAGRPEGRSHEFWFAARAEIEGEAKHVEKQAPEAAVRPPKASPAAVAKPATKSSAAPKPGPKPKAKKT